MEFDLINHYFHPLSQGLSQDDLGIGDDAAVLTVPDGYQVVITTDTMVEGVHFLPDCDAYKLAWKLLAVNLSDLAAMGAEPWCYSLALTLPPEKAQNETWLAEFTRGLTAIVEALGICFPLIGGDTTRGNLTLTISAKGLVKQGQAMLRQGSQVGDVLVVTNTIGDGALGLQVALNQLNDSAAKNLTNPEMGFVLRALEQPIPQTKLAPFLKHFANAALDISDGLLQDCQHLLNGGSFKIQSGLAAQINLEQMPLSSAMRSYIDATGDYSLVLNGGDDYQLLMSVDEAKLQKFIDIARENGVELSAIGKVVEGAGIRLFNNEEEIQEEGGMKGFQHF